MSRVERSRARAHTHTRDLVLGGRVDVGGCTARDVELECSFTGKVFGGCVKTRCLARIETYLCQSCR